jgi:hypothetical protein
VRNAVDTGYGNVPVTGLTGKILESQRRKLREAFIEFTRPKPDGSVLYLSLSSTDKQQPLSPGDSFPMTLQVTSYAVSDPRMKYSSGRSPSHERSKDLVHLPFADGQFDWAFCPEVIEHMPTYEKQYALIKELARVSRHGAFITTSNRKHPIEFNTGLPLLHWLPKIWWRRTLRWLGRDVRGQEAPLHLVGSKELYNIAMLLPGKPKHDVGHKRVLGLKAHFFLMIEKGKHENRQDIKPAGKQAVSPTNR